MSRINDLVSANPFPGLRPFTESEADRFFGRQKQIAELAERIKKVNLVAVAGVSGCGKSSLVCAGLLNELSRQTEAGSGIEWRYAVMRPGNKPIVNLAEKLSPVIGRISTSEELRVGGLYGRLRLGSLGLVEAVRIARLEPHVHLLVVVDQFEEIFRFKDKTDADEATAFIRLLLNAAHDKESPVSVVITLRSETLGSCADFLDLPEAINRGQYLVPKLTREQRKEAIVKPVELRGFTIAPRLVQRLLNDVSNSFDDVPLMQHVLSRIWNRWAEACEGSRTIDLEDYEAVGTTKQALSNHAEQAFESLSGLEVIVEKVFRALTERVSEGTELRRPLDFEQLCRVVGASRGEVEQVVERFRRPDTAFLMPPQEVPFADNPVIDISHESLIRQWQRLRDWAKNEAWSRAMLLRLVEAARMYGSKEGGLWREPNLSKALEWQQRTQPTPDWIALCVSGDGASNMELIERFLALSDNETRHERWRGKFQVWGLGFLVITLVALIIGAYLLNQSKSTILARKSLLELNIDPAKSAHTALAAIKKAKSNQLAEYALRQSLATLEFARTEKILPFNDPVFDARYSRDGSRLVIASGKTVEIYNTATFLQEGKPFLREADVIKAWLVADNSTLVTQTNDGEGNGYLQFQRIGDSIQQISCEGDGDWVSTVTVSPDEQHIAAGCGISGGVGVWKVSDLSAKPQIFRHPGRESETVTALAFSGKGGLYLASGYRDGMVNIWRLGHPKAWIGQGVSGARNSPIMHTGPIRDLGFHPDGPELLVSASDDTQAIIWKLDLKRRELATEQRNKWILKHKRPVILAKFFSNHDKKHTVMTVSDKTVRLWKDGVRDWRQVRRHEDWVNDANVSPKGDLLASASCDGTARLWSTRSGDSMAVLRGHREDVTRAVFNPAGDQLVTSSMDKTVRVWRFRIPQLLTTSNVWALSAAFDHAGARVAVGEEGGCIIITLKDNDEPVRQGLKGEPNSQYCYLSWRRDGKRLLGIRGGNGINLSVPQPVLWNIESLQEITPPWLKNCRMAAFNSGTDEVITVSKNGLIRVWDAGTLESNDPQAKTREFGGESISRLLIAMSPDGQWIAATEGDKVSLWNRNKPGTTPRKLEWHKGLIMSLQFSKDSKQLLMASKDMTASIWPLDPPGTRPKKVLEDGHTASLYSASFDSTGKFVVTGSVDSTIRIWDAETGKEHVTLRLHREGVSEVQFSPDGKSVLSASDDGTVRKSECEACLLPVKKLQERVEEFAKISEKDREEIRREEHFFHYLMGNWTRLWN